MKLFLFLTTIAVYATDTFVECSCLPYWIQNITVDEKIYEEKTEHQHLLVFQNALFGRVLALDHIVQLTESDEWPYHEMIAHIPLMAHPNPQHVLIIGGGDGGTLREVLKHTNVEKVTLVEISPAVVAHSKKYFPFISQGAFESPKLELIIQDGIEFISNTSKKFDVIICDSTDPGGPSDVLFTHSFYGFCQKALKDKGIFVNYTPLPTFGKKKFLQYFRNRRLHFKDTRLYMISLPTTHQRSFFRACNIFGFASNCDDYLHLSEAALEDKFKRMSCDFRYYNPEIHIATFALPEMINQVIK